MPEMGRVWIGACLPTRTKELKQMRNTRKISSNMILSVFSRESYVYR